MATTKRNNLELALRAAEEFAANRRRGDVAPNAGIMRDIDILVGYSDSSGKWRWPAVVCERAGLLRSGSTESSLWPVEARP